MIRIRSRYPEDRINEERIPFPKEVVFNEACKILHSRTKDAHMSKVICDTPEDQELLIKSYRALYEKDFNVCQDIEVTERFLCPTDSIAWPAEMDIHYYDNMVFHFEAGIRKLDKRYARVNTHETIFRFCISGIYECIHIDSEKNAELRRQNMQIREDIDIIEQLSHGSYIAAREYLASVWENYRQYFQEDTPVIDLEKIESTNSNYNLPWYERIRRNKID